MVFTAAIPSKLSDSTERLIRRIDNVATKDSEFRVLFEKITIGNNGKCLNRIRWLLSSGTSAQLYRAETGTVSRKVCFALLNQ